MVQFIDQTIGSKIYKHAGVGLSLGCQKYLPSIFEKNNSEIHVFYKMKLLRGVHVLAGRKSDSLSQGRGFDPHPRHIVEQNA